MDQQQLPEDEFEGRPNTPGEKLEVRAEDEATVAVAAGDRFAVVGRNGVLARGRGVVRTARLGLGQYEVIFNKNVRNCVYVATVGDTDALGSEVPGEITTVGRFNNVNGVFVTTHNSSGVAEDRSFHLYVGCP